MKRTTVLVAALLAAAGLAARAMPPAQAPALQGEVLEVRDVESYTYLRLKTKEGETWAAVPATAVKKGARVSIGNAMVMQDFESRTLKRKFDRIVFGTLGDAAARPAAAAPQGASPHGAAPAPAAPVAKVAKAPGAEGRTVAEVVGGKAALKDKPVAVRAQVVKVTSGILGKNWLHVQDGSGSAAQGTHDLIVTTKDTASVGDVVLARGTVRTDVNVGAGYAYAVLVEDAAVKK
ncbi:MAG: nucleotide-binding protein [Burkholderiales bacterium]